MARILSQPSQTAEESPLPSPPPPRTSQWKYDVFLSFRGADTRKGFVSHLYGALSSEGIYTFHDDRELERGNSIWPELLSAIKESRFAIVVLSENYATSRWCLEELLHITQCADENRLQLIPIFYDVEPSHVGRQSGSFEEAFRKHEKRYDSETVKKWREALAQVAKISGWDSKTWDEESKLTKEVARNLSARLSLPSSSGSNEFVGMDSHMRKIEALLCLDSGDVQMVGIWGMGGIGKTTIAKCVYRNLSDMFQGACLIENLKREFELQTPPQLREKILSDILRNKHLSIRGDDPCVMKQRLRGKKVFLVLDDVNDVKQLRELAGSLEWFGPGSRIIITTRDKRVLEQHDVEHIYEVEPLRRIPALQLFSCHAFRQPFPHKDFRELSVDVVQQLGGLPLALCVVGASLYRRDVTFWEDSLLLLDNELDSSISKALRESYEALNKREKMVFLYVACCFNGVRVDEVSKVLDLFVVGSGSGCRSFTGPSIRTLAEKCLISISNKKILWVHDLLQDMARDIICDGKEENPWKRKMLWDVEDFDNVLCENMGGEAVEVESIFLNMAEERELFIKPAIFRRMFNLKFLKFSNNFSAGGSKTCMPDGLDYLPMLRYLHWDAYTPKSLPSGFRTIYLVELILPNSSVETLWSGTQDLANLRRMNLSRSKRLTEIPDLSKATNLEKLELRRCESLVELHSSLEHLNKLVELELSYCRKLKSLPNNINLRALRSLHADGCPSLKEFPFISENVEELSLDETSIEEVPQDIELLSNLRVLYLSGCKRLKNLPGTIRNLDSLTELLLTDCPNITLFPEVGNNIEKLSLKGTAIEEVPSTIGDKSRLRYLNLAGCQKLGNLPPTLGNLARLKFLFLRGCTNVTMPPEVRGRMIALDLHGTSIEQTCLPVPSDEEPHDMPGLARYIYRSVLEVLRSQKSRKL
ncbi:PREDICTED: protein SUPPRESSOR OF npr1-1, CONSTITUTIVE 1-like [Tarenaya hassleriana]|uniref:protein SUPPRESSOR OF npr1-1, CONSTITUTIVE 1-like n=1 Tax=Tarenaya hassleriana TaxID=28532 RepID=UPI00053C8896|nr:PREDICTED: protein SUPPRESSOR OF npr1-1, CONSTITUTIVE 1-like [Tarenaya hassleriana]XP_010537833.1 PREDICTED: protein SUPPRESSOR OF npr1-1, CONSTITUTIVE 1-like [Tarenaya hassleriana]